MSAGWRLALVFSVHHGRRKITPFGQFECRRFHIDETVQGEDVRDDDRFYGMKLQR